MSPVGETGTAWRPPRGPWSKAVPKASGVRLLTGFLVCDKLSRLRQLIEENRTSVKQSRAAIDWPTGAIALLNRLEGPRTSLITPSVTLPKPPRRSPLCATLTADSPRQQPLGSAHPWPARPAIGRELRRRHSAGEGLTSGSAQPARYAASATRVTHFCRDQSSGPRNMEPCAMTTLVISGLYRDVLKNRSVVAVRGEGEREKRLGLLVPLDCRIDDLKAETEKRSARSRKNWNRRLFGARYRSRRPGGVNILRRAPRLALQSNVYLFSHVGRIFVEAHAVRRHRPRSIDHLDPVRL
jgi:hypothetical protein